jgi:hypothetical protein
MPDHLDVFWVTGDGAIGSKLLDRGPGHQLGRPRGLPDRTCRIRAAGIAMAYKLIEAAQSRWRAINTPHLVALVRAGARFENGKLVERPDETTPKEAA